MKPPAPGCASSAQNARAAFGAKARARPAGAVGDVRPVTRSSTLATAASASSIAAVEPRAARHVEQLAQALQAPHVQRIRGQRAPDIRDLVIDGDRARRCESPAESWSATSARVPSPSGSSSAARRNDAAAPCASRPRSRRIEPTRRCRAARSRDVDEPRLGGAQGLDRRLPLALAQVQVGETLERLRVAGAQASWRAATSPRRGPGP